ncbi:MAG: hypothetical protein QXK06_04190 [Candidatus Diapherotrites archaeon]
MKALLLAFLGFLVFASGCSVQSQQNPEQKKEVLSPSPIVSGTQKNCISVQQLESASACWVAVDGIVYDMTGMKRWETGKHFNYKCGDSLSLKTLPSSHSNAKYYGPRVGELCK